MKALIFFLIGILLTSSNFVSADNDDFAAISPYVYEDEIEAGLIEFLSPYDNITIAELPTISIQPENDTRIDLVVTLGNILLSGISDLTVHSMDLNPISRVALFDMSMNAIKVEAGYYSAAGHINTLPFNGESYMRVSLEGLNISLNVKYLLRPSGVCFEYGTTIYGLSIRKPEIYFDSLNPGTDLGQSLNIILSGMVYDTVDYIQLLLNGHQFLQIDTILIDTLNGILCSTDTH